METNIRSATNLLKQKQLTIAFAESATAGRITAEFSLTTDAGKFLKGGIACYSAELKEQLLNVAHSLIEKYTPESPEVTFAITEGISKLIKADIHIGVTGLPAPRGSETATKPVGTMFIHALLYGNTLFVDSSIYKGKPQDIILQTIDRVGELLTLHLTKKT